MYDQGDVEMYDDQYNSGANQYGARNQMGHMSDRYQYS